MAKRGPKPQPTALKLLRGTRADRVNDAEPCPPPGEPAPPAYLDAEGLAEWGRRAPDRPRATNGRHRSSAN